MGVKLHQAAVGFVGFRHQQSAFSHPAITAKGRHDAADHGGGVLVGGLQQAGHQAAGGGFAVAAGHRDRGLGVDQGGQHVGAMHHLQASAYGLSQLGIALRHRRAGHHQWWNRGATADGVDGAGILLAKHPHAPAAQLVHHRPLARIGSGDVEAPLRQNRRQGRHADATDTDEVQWPVSIEQGGLGQLTEAESASPTLIRQGGGSPLNPLRPGGKPWMKGAPPLISV